MLTTDETRVIQQEAMTGRRLSVKSPGAKELYQKVKDEVKEMAEDDVGVEMPFELPD